jgi:DNA-binding NarL/FixJ family response regulator
MIKILLVEDQAFIRKAVKLLLDKEEDFSVTGEAGNFSQAVSMLKDGLNVNIIIADVNVAGMNAIEFIAEAKSILANVKLIFLSSVQSERTVSNIINAGANGFLNKSIDVTELMFAIRHVYNDGQYLCSSVTKLLLDNFSSVPEVKSMEIDHDIEFPAREIEILILMANGYTNYEIAEKLFTSKRTVEGHRQNLLNKTGSRNTAALIKFAIQYGVIKC